MEGQQNQVDPGRPKARGGRWTRLLFAAVLLCAAVLVYWLQIRGTKAPGDWGEDLAAALRQAAEANRPVLVFFVNDPPGDTENRLSSTTLSKPENTKAIKEGGFIRARVKVPSLTSELAVKYKLKDLPVLMMLDSRGNELNRRVGFVGEVPFRNGFLDCKELVKP